MSKSLAALKLRAPIFTFVAFRDNWFEMGSVSPAFDPEHPLLMDRERLNRIADVMHAKIQKILFSENIRRRQGTEVEQVLEGTAVSAKDVLAEALIGLLQYPPDRLERKWEGLAVRIARNKAFDALRASQKGLRQTEHRPQLQLISGDAKRKGRDGDTQSGIFEVLPSTWGDPEAEYLVIDQALGLRDLARDLLDERAREIFFAIHFEGYSRTEVGERLGLTSQRIGQIYRFALRILEDHPNYPFKLDD